MSDELKPINDFSRMLNYQDVTLKARISKVEQMEVRLVDLGAHYIGEDQQHDTYFTCIVGKLKFRKGTLGTLITHYERIGMGSTEKTHVYRYDINPSEEEVQQLYAMHEVVGETHKIRKLYQLGNVSLHLDLLPSGENFIEVEAKDYADEFSFVELQAQCQSLFEQMGINPIDVLQTGYLQ